MFGFFRRKRPADPVPSGRSTSLAEDSPRIAGDAITLSADAVSNKSPDEMPRPRSLLLRDQNISWHLVRSRRRTIGFQIDHRGLRVSAPRWVPVGEIEQALSEKSDWIIRKLAEWREHERRREERTPSWQAGSGIRYLGQELLIELVPEQRGVRVNETRLAVGLPLNAGPDDIRVRIEFWMKDQARTVFAERMALYSQKLGRAPCRWSLSSARTRWGSCNPDGSIRLNWRLMHFSVEVIDYVIAHELTHLIEMNHGPRFWATLATLYPDYERVRGLLRHHYDDTPAG